MRGSAVAENAINIGNSDFNTSTKVEPEYVLKVNFNDAVDVKSISPKNNPNPGNLPAVRKKINVVLRRRIVLFLFFTFCFLFAVLISFNALFMLFE